MKSILSTCQPVEPVNQDSLCLLALEGGKTDTKRAQAPAMPSCEASQVTKSQKRAALVPVTGTVIDAVFHFPGGSVCLISRSTNAGSAGIRRSRECFASPTSATDPRRIELSSHQAIKPSQHRSTSKTNLFRLYFYFYPKDMHHTYGASFAMLAMPLLAKHVYHSLASVGFLWEQCRSGRVAEAVFAALFDHPSHLECLVFELFGWARGLRSMGSCSSLRGKQGLKGCLTC